MRVVSLIFVGTLHLAAAALLPPAAAHAASLASDWAGIAESRARLVSAVAGVGRDASVVVGLEITLAPGFKTYWRAGGSGGPAPKIDWRDSDNLAEAIIRWPAPQWYETHGYDTIGYAEHVVLPIELRPIEPGKPIALLAAVQWVACSEICIPIVEDIALSIPPGPAVSTEDANRIEHFLRQVPGDDAVARLEILSALSGAAERPMLTITVGATGKPLRSPRLFVEGPADVVFSRPKVRLVADGWRAVFRVHAEDLWGEQEHLDLTGAPLVVTVVDDDRALEAEIAARR